MISRILAVAASVAAASLAVDAAHAAAPDFTQFVCAVDGVTVDPRFCADYVDPAALWVDPFVTGGTRSEVAIPPAGFDIPWTATGHADGLRVEGLRP